MDVGWLFLVSSIEVPNMPLTLCHSSLIDTDIPRAELENRHLVHPLFTLGDIWHLKSLLVSMLNTKVFHDFTNITDRK